MISFSELQWLIVRTWTVYPYNAAMSESIGARLANVVLPEAGGGEVRLGSLWEQSLAVIVFLRHYG